MQFRAEYNPADEEESFAISTFKKYEIMRAERERLSLEIKTLQDQLLSLQNHLTDNQAENKLL